MTRRFAGILRRAAWLRPGARRRRRCRPPRRNSASSRTASSIPARRSPPTRSRWQGAQAASRRRRSFAHAPRSSIGKVAKRTLLPGRFVPLASVRDAYLVEQGASVQVMFIAGRPDHLGDGGHACSRVRAGDIVKVRNIDSGTVFPAPSWPTARSGSARHEACARFILALALIAGLQPAHGFWRRPRRRCRRRWRRCGGRWQWRCCRRQRAMATVRGGRAHAGQRRPLSRIKDIAALQSARDNQLVGYGLVIGLQGTRRQPAQFALHRTVDPRDAGESRHRAWKAAGRAPRTSRP